MSATYQTIVEKDFSSGINKLAAEDAVPQSYVENMENMQPNAQGYVEKRKGYQAYAGSLPLRASKAERTAEGLLCLYFDEIEGGTAAIDFSTLKPSPVIVYGQSSIAGWTTETSKYFSTFKVDPRVKLGSPVTLPAADVGAKSRDVFIGLGYNPPAKEGTKDNEVVYAESLSINTSTFAVSIGAIPNIPASPDVNCFVYIKNHATLAGESWAATISPTTTVGSVHTYTITQVQHQLNTQNYISRFYTVSGLEIFPDSLTVTGSTLTAQFTDNDATWDGQLRVIIASIPEIDVETRAVTAGQTVGISFPIAADFAFFEVYQENGSTLSRVFPDSIAINSQTATVAVTNLTTSQVNFRILWDRASVRTNKLCVIDAGVASVDATPQLVLYGLDHETLYPDMPDRAGWVTHIDSYKSEGENYLVAGLGWNLFKAVTHTSLPARQPLLRVSVATAVKAGPLFGSASNGTNWARDRISYSFTGGNEGWANIESIQYQESSGWIKIKLYTPNRAKHNNGGSAALDVTHDRLTVQGASQTVHRGEWAIMQFEETDAEYLTFWVYNPNVDSSDYDEESVGEAGVFTDKVTFTAPSDTTYSLVVGDILEGAAFPQGLSGSLSCVSTTGSTSYFNGVGEPIEFPGGQVYTVRRTGRMLRVRNVNSPASNPYEDFVPGDVLALSDRDRRYRILNIVAANTTGISAEFNEDVVGQATLTGLNSSPFKVGQWITLASAGRFSGEYQIKELPDTLTIILDCSNVKDRTTSVPAGAYIQGRMFELNYSDEFYDDPNSLLSVTVPLRWFPIENPTGSPLRVKHFESKPYTNQNFVRSVMAQDNMYFANYDDHLLKYDGAALYRSGLVRWQPGLFVTVEAIADGKIIVPVQVTSVAELTKDSYKIVIPLADADKLKLFEAGNTMEVVGSTLNPFTIVSIDVANRHIFLNKPVDLASTNTGTVKQYNPNIYRYYFRLTAYDANDNIVTSATTGSNEFQVVLTESAAVNLRLVGLPKFEQLNYSRVFLEVYRTKRNAVSPFYNIVKKAIEFDATKPYIDVTDTISDEALPAQPDDAVLTFLAGSSLGNGLSQPPQAKYCTAADNRLVLGNIQDDPKIQVDIYGNPALTEFASKTFYLRKDSTTNTNDLTFDLVSSTLVAISAVHTGTTATFTISGTGYSFVVGEWLYFLHNTVVSNRTAVDSTGWYQVQSATEVSGNTQITIHLQATPTWNTLLVGRAAISGAFPVLNNYMTYDASTKLYTVTTTPGTDYYKVTLVTGSGAAEIYTIVHYHFPEKIARCLSGNRNSTGFPVYTGADYNYGWRNANSELLYSPAARVLLRLSNAINFSQTVSSKPWVFANAGLDLGGQTMVLAFPENSLTTTPELVFPAVLGSVEYYGNKVKVTAGAQVGAVTAKFPSRVVISYANYAEVFHRPFDESATLSESIIDVNPADGQEITGVFPFFSESAFGAALKSASIIVFKTNSIYIVDPVSRRAQQLETNGLGCTAPYSIAATREGLMFANEAGLYRLTRSLTVEPIGSYIDRLWRETVNHSQLSLMQGHAYGVGRRYKVSIPKTDEKVPSNVLVYDYTREDSRNTYGSWTQYTNHAATGWCNLLEDAYFGSTRGRVYKVSNSNSRFDYQDDGSAISGFTVFRALDFGDSAIRKRVLHLLVHYRIPNLAEGQVDISTATVSMGVNLVDNFLALDTFKLDVPNSPDGLSTLTPNKQITLRYAVRNPKSLYFQVKVEDTGLHTPLQVTGLSFRVAGLSTEGIKEAAQTMKE